MRLTLAIVMTISAVVGARSLAAEPWRDGFWLGGGGYWAQRQLVIVTADAASGTEATPIVLTVGEGEGQLRVIGQRRAAMRVCDAAGQELLFDVHDAEGATRHDGVFAAGDRVTFIATCPSGESASYSSYSDNADAEPVVEFLTTRLFANGGFEAGDDEGPHAWRAIEVDSRHRVNWSKDVTQRRELRGLMFRS